MSNKLQSLAFSNLPLGDSAYVFTFYLVAILYFNKEILIWHSAPDMVLNALQIKKIYNNP